HHPHESAPAQAAGLDLTDETPKFTLIHVRVLLLQYGPPGWVDCDRPTAGGRSHSYMLQEGTCQGRRGVPPPSNWPGMGLSVGPLRLLVPEGKPPDVGVP